MESGKEPVVLVTDQPPFSGIGTYVRRLSELLRENFPEIEVRNLHYFATSEAPGSPTEPGHRYARTRLGALGALRHNERSLAEALRGRGTLVHLCGASYDLATRVDRPIATVHDFGLRTLGSIRSTEPRLLLVEGYSMVEWLRTPRFLKRCRDRISVSQFTQARLEAWTGLRSTVIPHWVDPSRFRPRSREASRAKLGLPADRRVLLSVGSGRAYKNHALLGRVVEALPPDYLLVKVGFPLSGLGTRVRNEGTVPEERYPEYFAAADAYVHLSFREGFGIPLIESLASGTPIVALANPPAPEILGDVARLVPPTSLPAAIVAAIRSIVEDPAEANRLTALGLQRSREFDPRFARARYTEVYLNAMRS